MPQETGNGRVHPKESNRAWAATLEGRYEEALQQWDAILARDQRSLGFYENRGITRLLVGEMEGALEDFLEARHNPSFFRLQVPFVGVTLWLQGKHDAACEDWANEITRRRAGEFTHVTDDAGGVEIPALLWWASAHPALDGWRKTAEAELQRRGRTKQCQRSSWPGPVVPFLLGSTTEEDLSAAVLASYSPDTGVLAAWRQCKAHFYLGARALDQGNITRYREQLSQAMGQEPSLILHAEYHLARADLQALDREGMTFPDG